MTDGPFHPGERLAQSRAGAVAHGGLIRTQMPDQHRRFFEALPFVVVASTGERGPIATLWTGAPGLLAAPDPETLRFTVALDPADPASAAFTAGAPFGMLGIELASRRRNRANGVVTAVDATGVSVAVRQSIGNCPQYIQPRELTLASPTPAEAEPLARLDPDATHAIATADTFFVASAARTDEPTGGVDVSHRGGPAGFVRVLGGVLTIPDYPGNRYFNTLGNLVCDPRAALLFVDFARGDVLHIQGKAEIQWDGPEVAAHDGAQRLWRVHVERAWRRRGALAVREATPETAHLAVPRAPR